MGGERIQNRKHIRFLLACAALAFGSQMLVFYGTRLLPAGEAHLLATQWDEAIPLAPVWITVYLLVFADWLACGIEILSERRSHALRFTCAYVIAMLISGVIFVVFPCAMARPEVPGADFFSALLRLVYLVDPPDHLFPSLHVLVTYLCWRGCMGCRKLPKWFAPLQFGILICVCLSILFVKQHVLADIPPAIAVGELAMQISGRLPFAREREREERA